MGRRIDAVLLINGVVISVEFKIGTDQYLSNDIDQASDYALDLKYFHEATHDLIVVPVLVATEAPTSPNNSRDRKRAVSLDKNESTIVESARIPDLHWLRSIRSTFTGVSWIQNLRGYILPGRHNVAVATIDDTRFWPLLADMVNDALCTFDAISLPVGCLPG
jgi:hypothetical protein